MHLVISHRRRVKINALCQAAAVKKYKAGTPEGRVVLVEPPAQEEGQSSLKIAQPFELFEGTRLVGANNETTGIFNGVFMTVGQVRDGDCDVTDEFGNAVASDPVNIHDIHATILHQMGLDHEKLTYRYSGRNWRLTDVHGQVIKEILA